MRVTALAASLDAVPGAAGAIPRILVVDDERPLRDVLVRVLRRRGFEALEGSRCRDGALAAQRRGGRDPIGDHR